MDYEHKTIELLREHTGMLERIDERTKHMAEAQKVNDETTASNTKRIRDLEMKPIKWLNVGITAFITMVVGAIVGFFIKQ